MVAKKNAYSTSRKILVLYFVVLLIIPYILLSVLQIVFYVNSIKTETLSASKETVEQINLTVSKQANKIQNFITTISTSGEYKRFLEESYSGLYGYDLRKAYKDLGNIISNNTNDDLQISSVVVVNNENRVYTFGDAEYLEFADVKNSHWYDETVEAKGKLCWFEGKGSEASGTLSSLIAARKIYDITTFEEIGVIYIEVLNDFFDVRIPDEDDKSMMYIIDGNKTPLCSIVPADEEYDRTLHEQIIRTITDEGARENEIRRIDGKYYFTVVSSPGYQGWFVAKVIPAGQLLGAIIKNCLVSGAILFCCFGLFFAMFLVVYNRIANPLQYLIGLVNEIKADPDTDIDLGKYPCYEAIKISSEIVNMTKEKDLINKELKEVSLVKTKAELDKLQAQINPHFIYNTLTAVKYMAIQNHQQEIGSMVTALVRILRSAVNRDGQFITVEEEVDNLQQYIYIQRVLYNNKIDFGVKIAPEVLRCYIPNFILQPLVENAVIHGLNPKGCEGRVDISIAQRAENMVIEITDDGVGVDLDKVNRANPVHNDGAGVSNIALPGVMKKIELLYDGRGIFEIGPVVSGGTKVTIVLPMKFKAQEMTGAE